MKKVIKLNEKQLNDIVKRTIKEYDDEEGDDDFHEVYLFLDTLSLPEEEKVRLGNLIYDYGQEMWEEGARGGFADKYM